MDCLFVTDLHGSHHRYQTLFDLIRSEKPDAVFVGGDLLPHASVVIDTPEGNRDFLQDYLVNEFEKLRSDLGPEYPSIFIILGNDDPGSVEEFFIEFDNQNLIHYIPEKAYTLQDYTIYGYPYVPPTPFRLKDWEKYDVSRYVDPGCISPEEGVFSTDRDVNKIRFETIDQDLKDLVQTDDMSKTIMLFHSPPHNTKLDRAALDGKMIDHVPLDPHVGSIAIRRFIEKVQPKITLHGHIHESTKLTDQWRDSIGRTEMLNAAHHGPELSVISFDPDVPEQATRRIL